MDFGGREGKGRPPSILRRKARVRGRRYVGILSKRTSQIVNQGGTADKFLFVLDRRKYSFVEGRFLLPTAEDQSRR